MQRPASGISALDDYPHLLTFIYNFEPDDQLSQLKAEGKISNSNHDESDKSPLVWQHLVDKPLQLKRLEEILSDETVFKLAMNIAYPNILDELLNIHKDDLIFRLKLGHSFVNLNFWGYDLRELADQLEDIITNKKPSANDKGKAEATSKPDVKSDKKTTQYFADSVAMRAAKSKNLDNTFSIEATDPDLVKYFKSFINLVRAVSGIDKGIKSSYISHLLAKDGWFNATDGNLQSIVTRAVDNPDQFEHLLQQFLAFKFYAVEVGDMLAQIPLLPDEVKKVLGLFKIEVAKTSVNNGVALIKGAYDLRNTNHESLLQTKAIPKLDESRIAPFLKKFGLMTYLQSLTEMLRIMNDANKKQYYDKVSDSFSYPPSVNEENKKLMEAYNACAGMHNGLRKAFDAYQLILGYQIQFKLNKESKWNVLDEDHREEYLKLNAGLQKAIKHASNLMPKLHQYSRLTSLMKGDEALIERQIEFLNLWQGSDTEKAIDALENGLSVDKAFNWISEKLETEVAKNIRDDFYIKAKKLFDMSDAAAANAQSLKLGMVPSVPLATMNLMISYNINARLKRAYDIVEELRTSTISIDMLKQVVKLLKEIGHMVNDFHYGTRSDLIEKLRVNLEQDINILLRWIAPHYHSLWQLCATLELEQGLRPNLLLDYIRSIQKTIDYLATANNVLSVRYKLDLNLDEFNKDAVNRKLKEAEELVDIRKQELSLKACRAREKLPEEMADLLQDPYNFIDILKAKELIQTLPGHNADRYVELLEDVLKKMFGLDVLEYEIKAIEREVRKIIGDNVINLKEHVHDERIQKHLKCLKKLYTCRAELQDMLSDLEKYKYNDDQVKLIEIKKFNKQGVTIASVKWLASWVYDTELDYWLDEGYYSSVDLGSKRKDLAQAHAALKHDLSDWIMNPVISEDKVPEVLPFVRDTSRQDAVKQLIDTKNQHKMLENILRVRKGNVVSQIEGWRKLFTNNAQKVVDAGYQEYLEKNCNELGMYQHNDSDPILIVGIKAINNSMVRIERTLETLLQFGDISTDSKLSIVGSVPHISSVLSELKSRLNELLRELEILTEALRALVDCMRNNTTQVFERDIAGHFFEAIRITKEVVKYLSQKAPQKDPNAVVPVNEYLEKFNRYSVTIMESLAKITKQNSHTAVKKEIAIADTTSKKKKNKVHSRITKNLVLYVHYNGGIERSTDGDKLYDVTGLIDGSTIKRAVVLLNNHILSGLEVPKFEDIEKSDTNANYKKILLKVTKSLGLAAKHYGAADKAFSSDAVDADGKGVWQATFNFAREFLALSGVVAAQGEPYDLSALPDGSLNKTLAALINIENNVNHSLQTTASMANGTQGDISGLITLASELIKIRRKLDTNYSDIYKIFNDTLVQFDFDVDIVKKAIDKQVLRALNYIEPKIIDAVVKARVGEIATGMKEHLIVDQLKKAIKFFVKIGPVFGKDYKYLERKFPFNKETRETAVTEFARLKALNEVAEAGVLQGTRSTYHYMNRALNSLGNFIGTLQQEKPEDKSKVVQVYARVEIVPALPGVPAMPTVQAAGMEAVAAPVMLPPRNLSGGMQEYKVLQKESEQVSEEFSSEDETAPLIPKATIPVNPPIPAKAVNTAKSAQKKAHSLSPEEEALKANVNLLDKECYIYKTHLVKQIIKLRQKAEPGLDCGNDYPLDKEIEPIDRENEMLKLTREKFNAVHAMHEQLHTRKAPSEKLAGFSEQYTEARKETLNTRRDSAGITFLKAVLTALSVITLTFGFVLGFGLWRPKGEKLGKEIDKLTKMPVMGAS